MAAAAPRIETREDRRVQRIALAALLTLVLLGARLVPGWATIDGRAFDAFSTLAPPVIADPGAILIAIDEPSFSALEMQWPWPRDLHARLVEALRGAGAKAIGFDVVFADPSVAEADAALARVTHADTVLAAEETVIETPQASTLLRTEPLAALLAGGARAGIASVSLDGDGVLRRVPRAPDSFARRLAEAAGARRPAAGGDRLVQYLGAAGSYPRVSYYQALEPAKYLPPDYLRGRTVIVGYSLHAAADLDNKTADTFETPYTATTGQLTPGIEIQATLLDNLLHGLSIRELPAWVGWAASLLAGLAGFALARPSSPSRKALAAIGAIVLIALGAWLLLRFGRVWLSPANPVLTLAAVTAGLAARDYALERRLRRDVQGAFAQYLSPTMIERLVADPSLLRLGGEARDMTILFADIRGFTTISERMKDDPQALVQMINGIMTPLSNVVVTHGGTIDKYIGDCIMAFWNAPLDDPDHAGNAARAAVAMVGEMDAINQRIAQSLPPGAEPIAVRIGIGVNSGRCVVGNMGSDHRFDYSVLGDPVNVASRLEGKSKEYGVPIVIGEATAQLIGDALPLRLIDRIAVRGKQEAQGVFTLADGGSDA